MAGIKRSGKEGFSLLEVLISLAILAVGLLALAMFQVTAIKGNAIASRWTVATQLTQDQLEDFRHADWDNIVSSPRPASIPATMQPVYTAFPGPRRGDTYVDNVSDGDLLHGLPRQQQQHHVQDHHRVDLLAGTTSRTGTT